MRHCEQMEQWQGAIASGEVSVAMPSGLPAAGATIGEAAHPNYRPAPGPDGSLIHDPDFTLQSTAGPLEWALYHDSFAAGVAGPYGYGRFASFPLYVRQDTTANIVTVMHEDGTKVIFRRNASTGTYYPSGANYQKLQQNTDTTWDETHVETGYRYHFGPGNDATLEYRETPQGQFLTYNYDAQNRLASVEEPAGRQVVLGYADNAVTTVSYIQDWAGRRNTLVYDASANLIEVHGPTGCIVEYEYDGSHQISKITDPEGYSTTYTYDGSNRVLTRSVAGNYGAYAYASDANGVVSMTYTDPIGRIWTHVTSGRRLRLRDIDPLGNVWSYSYLNYRPISMTDPLGRTTSFVYDANGLVIEVENALGNRWLYPRDEFGNILRVIDPLSRRTTLSYGDNPEYRQPVTVMNALSEITSFTYLSNGLLQEVEDALGFRTTFVWNDYGERTEVVDPLNRRVTATYYASGDLRDLEDSFGKFWTFTYDEQSRLTSVRNPLEQRWTTVYDARELPKATIDPLGFRTTMGYNAYGTLVSVTNALGNQTLFEHDAADQLTGIRDALAFRTTYVYDGAGRPVEQQDALGFRTTLVYNAAGEITAQADALNFRTTMQYLRDGSLEAIENARGFRTTFAYDAAGQQVEIRDSFGYRWTSVYDALGRLQANVNTLNRRVTLEYDRRGNQTAVLNQLSRRWTTSYDEAGYVKGFQTPRGSLTTLTYDANARLAAVETPLGYRTTLAYDLAGQVIETQDALGNRWTTVYDLAGQPTGAANPLNFRYTTSYDAVGQPVATMDPNARLVTLVFDAVGQVTSRQDEFSFVTTYVYDGAGQQIETRDALGNRSTTLYDARGLVSAEIDALNNRLTYGYDGVGNVTTALDARGFVTTSVYDALDRETQRRYPDSTRVTWSFNSLGQLDSVKDNTGTTDFVYNVLGLLSSQQQPGDLRLTYGYDVDNNRTLLRVPKTLTERVTYLYDAQGRVTEIQNPWGERTTITWDGLDREQRRVFGNGMSTSHTYDAAGRETGLRTVDAAGVDLQRYTATYDRAGNRLTVRELDDTRVTFTYDRVYRLVSEQRDRSQAYNKGYNYSATGNRTRYVEQISGYAATYSYNAANQLTLRREPGEVRTTYIYDGNGNLLSEDRASQVTQYTWDTENRLTSQIEPDSSRYTYTYRYNNRRYQNETPDGAKRILLWDDLTCLEEVDETTALQAFYTNYPGEWGGLASQRRGADSTYYGFDLQWTGRLLVAQSGLVSDSYIYDAFGVELAATGTTVNSYRYKGQYEYRRDTEDRSDVWNNQLARDLGRWISPDALSWGSGQTPYAYCGNNPVSGLDPWGLRDLRRTLGAFVVGGFIGVAIDLTYDGDYGAYARDFVNQKWVTGTPGASRYWRDNFREIDAWGAMDLTEYALGIELFTREPITKSQVWQHVLERWTTPQLGTIKGPSGPRIPCGPRNNPSAGPFAMHARGRGPVPAGRKIIVIGETMDRVKTAGRKYNVRWYQGWLKDNPSYATMMRRNKAWLEGKKKAGYRIITIGLDPKRSARSPFYEEEIGNLKRSQYPFTHMPE